MYFLTVNTVFRGQSSSFQTAPGVEIVAGNSTWAGATAAITANLVLIAYVVVAMKEDQSDKIAAEQSAKKKR